MIDLLLKYGKKILITFIMVALLMGNIMTTVSFADYSENTIRDVDVVVRAGEWKNSETAKPGKRYDWGTDISLSKHGINIKDVPLDIPLRKGDDGFYISEADINLKTARAIARKLDYKGVNVDLQYSSDGTQDLNAAGRIASLKNPKIYLSIHHNSYKETSEGYFFIVNKGDYKSSNVAELLSDSLKDNGFVPQLRNRINEDSYIGELNTVTKSGRIAILSELGFFSNPKELLYIMSDEYVNIVSDRISEEVYKTLLNDGQLLQEAYENTLLECVEETKDEPITIIEGDGIKITIGGKQ